MQRLIYFLGDDVVHRGEIQWNMVGLLYRICDL